MEKIITEADVFLGMLERAEKRTEDVKITNLEKECEKLVERVVSKKQLNNKGSGKLPQ